MPPAPQPPLAYASKGSSPPRQAWTASRIALAAYAVLLVCLLGVAIWSMREDFNDGSLAGSIAIFATFILSAIVALLVGFHVWTIFDRRAAPAWVLVALYGAVLVHCLAWLGSEIRDGSRGERYELATPIWTSVFIAGGVAVAAWRIAVLKRANRRD